MSDTIGIPTFLMTFTMYLLVALLVSFTTVVVGNVPSTTDISAVVNACNQFSFDLNEQIKKPGTNTFFSSYSICTAMAMVLAGAAGNTATQLRNTFHYDAKQNIDPVYQKFIEDFNNPNNSAYTLSTANRIYGDKKFKLNQTYQSNLKTYYKAPLEQVDFSSGTAENTINQWVSQQTHEKIQTLFPPGSLGPGTQLVLANAIYFKGTWLTKFNKASTKKETFKVSQGTNQQVDMMNLRSHFPYKYDTDLNAKVLHMFYSGDSLCMFVVLPNEDFGLEAVMKKLNAEKIKSLLNIPKTTVKVKFPKFKLETEYELTEALKKLKSTDVFSDSAKLPGISEVPLKISTIRHKAFVQLDEEGTEAAAATGIGAVITAVGINPPEPPHFYADHPFYFAIMDKASGLVLFSGTVTDPTKMKV